ncbi:unnamed protein product [Rotaria sordida]|uniref:Uncharacterized protein n=1 Tax=Rotaria sordida TaxID=392033 RepID=A0A813WXD2_9BILA|nr:unnamed protein product [Rotaria sordida]CAF3710897.1 unnamed protein product [Rotaria sordida]
MSLMIPKLLLSSAHPGAKNLNEHRCITRAIYDCGIEVFVNLMRPIDLTHFTPYEPEIRQYAILRLGGHGRTDTIISILIGMLFQLEADDALHYNHQLQKQCLRTKGRTTSLTSYQYQQVRNILRMYKD